MSVPATKNLWRALAIVSVVIFAYATVLGKLTHDWWTDENYSHGLLIPFVIGYILWLQRARFASESFQPSLFWGGGAILFVCSLGRCCRRGTLHAAPLIRSDPGRNRGLFLGRSLIASDARAIWIAPVSDSHSGNHLQQDSFSSTTVRIPMRSLVHESFKYSGAAPGKHNRVKTS